MTHYTHAVPKNVNASQKGFSLIEFALVMVISGLVLTVGLGLYTTHIKGAKLDNTYTRLYNNNDMMEEVWSLAGGRYFCPADPSLPSSDPNFGMEDCATAITTAGNCTNSGNGVCVGQGVPDPAGGSGQVLIGMFPFKSVMAAYAKVYNSAERAAMEQAYNNSVDPEEKENIRKSMEMARKTRLADAGTMPYDGWSNQFTYVVTRDLTAAGEDRSGAGAIEIVNEANNQETRKGVHYALISHGINGKAAYSRSGNRVVTCDAGNMSTQEMENCDGDGTFMRPVVASLGATLADEADDIVIYNRYVATDLWKATACDTDGDGTDDEVCLSNKNEGNVAIGLTDGFSAAAGVNAQKLTVGGQMRAEKTSSVEVCDADGNNCFTPSFIGGGSTPKNTCDQTGLAANERRVMQKVENGEVHCVVISVAGTGGSCPAEYFVQGFDVNGDLVCADPCEDLTADERTSEETVTCPSGTTGTLTYRSTYDCATRSWGTWTQIAGSCVPDTTPVDGACGAADGTTVAVAPTTDLCSTGTASAVSGSGPWSWTCQGVHGGADDSCSANMTPPVVNGACGPADGTTVSTPPAAGLCNTGTASAVSGSGPWSWTCQGSGGGTDDSCAASLAATPVNGACRGYGSTYTSQPATSSATGCTAGSYTDLGDTASNWIWRCDGLNGGTNSGNCTAAKPAVVNGVCNNAVPLGCSAGSAISDNGQTACDTTRQWVCQGSGGGTNSGTCSRFNGACSVPVNGSCSGTPGACNAGSPGGDNYASSCGTTRTWTCYGYSGGSNASCSSYNGACAPPVNGSCSTTGGACTAGSSTGDNGATSCGTTRTWTCQGLNGGSNASCSKSNGTCAVNGVCSTTAGACSVGTPSGDNYASACGTTRTWSCNGSGGGSTASCSKGNAWCVCGPTSGSDYTMPGYPVPPTSGLCTTGTPGPVTLFAGMQWQWTCGAMSPTCYASTNGQPGWCGPAAGGTYSTSPPAGSLCGMGAVLHVGPYNNPTSWDWNCKSTYTNTGYNCKAFKP